MQTDDQIVIAGGRGFVGRALIEELKKRGHTKIRCVTRKTDEPWITRDGVEYYPADLHDYYQALGSVRDAKYVFNLAALVGGIDFIQNNRFMCMLSAHVNMNLLLASRYVDAVRFFFASSACVYSSNEFPIRENFAHPANPERGYGWEKLFGEQLCREFGHNTRIARYFTLYGPGDDKFHNHFPAELCKKVAHAKISGLKEIEVWGDGSQVRSLLYIDDCVEGTLRIMNSDTVNWPVNLSHSDYMSVDQMTELVQKIAGTDLKVKHVPGVTGVQSRYSSNELIRREFGWEPKVGMLEGFEKTYRWWYDKISGSQK
jgi:nucleoside-diphosphate-sugar epimerase